ncbi:MAG: hypothetical protein K5880_18995 [Hydrogenophaga sp.]|jgi:hypothetical protein|uniref:hypothetical protein n=1 Tax=Hydrogenophaga sp. TaxID=1904254 RepID=UPI00261A8850|nr:hypothetical protein [Hydrogenophaga sp.]MCV0440683.1 hypothetical protein [Hydrogenophaga sp.]
MPMFERLKKAWLRLHWSSAQREPLTRWAQARGLVFTPQVHGAYVFSGNWSGQPVRIECTASSRPFIKGMELMARADLGLQGTGGVVLMNRALKLHLEQWASELYSRYTDTLQTTAHALPDEVRWLAMYRDAGWTGPDRRFWARYAVLTDTPDIARQWIDSDGLQRLMDWPANAVAAETPLMLMVMRGKAYMRLQIDAPRDTATALHALDLFHHFSEQARKMLAPR